jgi:MFS family permease
LDLGIDPMPAALLLSYIGGGNILGRIMWGRISDSIGRKQTFLICALLLMGTMLWFTKSSSWWMLHICATIFGLSFGGDCHGERCPQRRVLRSTSYRANHGSDKHWLGSWRCSGALLGRAYL